MKNYFDFVKEFEVLANKGKNIELGSHGSKISISAKESPKLGKCGDCAASILIFAPHPDDESMIGSLALRLQKESGFKVCDVAVTLGSNQERRAGRRAELASACNYLDWQLYVCGQSGFDDIKPDTKERNPKHWESCVAEIASVLQIANPALIFMPHENDWNKTHMGVGKLVREAIERLGEFKGLIAETEYWGAMTSPNLMIEVDAQTVAEQITAVSCHTKEVERNDYHLRLPSWMSDNVRRGGEIVGGQGGAAPSFAFGVIYDILTFENGKFNKKFKGTFISKEESVCKIFE